VVKDFSDPDLDHWLDAAGVSIFDCKGTVGDMLRLGLEKCTGEIVCFLDDDDLFLPQKLQEVTRVFSARPSLVFYHNGYETIDESGSTVRCRAYRPVRSSLELETGSLKLSKLVSLKYSGHLHNLSSISVRREALTPFLGTIGAIRGTTDCAMFLLAASTNGLLRFDSRVLTLYRVGQHSRTRQLLRHQGGAEVDWTYRADGLQKITFTLDRLQTDIQREPLRRFAELLSSSIRLKLYLVSSRRFPSVLRPSDVRNTLLLLSLHPSAEVVIDMGLSFLARLYKDTATNLFARLLTIYLGVQSQ
jgi:hypothetical protein